MQLIALTGGIASGKSLAASRFRELGAVHVDADVLAREVVEPGSEGLAEIVREFGEDMLLPDGSLDRPALGAVVFGNPARLAVLNGITHPRVRELARRRIAEAAASDPQAIVMYDVPLLAEAPAEKRDPFDLVIVVHADAELRVERMMTHRGMSENDARRRIAAQATDDERLALADIVLHNDSDIPHLLSQVDAAWQSLKERGDPAPTP